MTDQPTDSHAIPVASTQEPYEPDETPDGWFDEPEELPRRPRGRLLTPLPITLLCVLLTACGFIGGVLVEKGQEGTGGSAGSGTSALAGRFAALRSAAGRSGAGIGAGGTAGGGGAGAGGATTGQVAFVQGSTLYVTDSSGNTIKVKTSAASTVTKTVSGTVHAIRPGEEVVVSGTTASNGTVTAASIRVGGGAASGLAGLFGGGTGTSTGSSTAGGTGATSPTGSEGPALFGGG